MDEPLPLAVRARRGKPRIQTREDLRITAPVLDPTRGPPLCAGPLTSREGSRYSRVTRESTWNQNRGVAIVRQSHPTILLATVSAVLMFAACSSSPTGGGGGGVDELELFPPQEYSDDFDSGSAGRRWGVD